MSESEPAEQKVVVIGPDGRPVAVAGHPDGDSTEPINEAIAEPISEHGGGRGVTELVEQPAKVMRIGTMVRQLLEEVKASPLDEASRNRLRDIHQASIKELEGGLAPELVEELKRLSLPFSDAAVPSEGDLRVA